MTRSRTSPISAQQVLDDNVSTVSKAAVLAALARAGVPSTLPLASALETCPSLCVRRDAAVELDACLLQLAGITLTPLLPESLAHWPVWYIRLPSSWVHDVPSLVWRDGLSPCLGRDESNPWYVGQWLTIAGFGNGAPWEPNRRQLVIDDRDVSWSIDAGLECGGVIVLYESGENVTITGYPIDEQLVCALQAGDGASCRHPLFDLALDEVQAMTRALEDGEVATASPTRLRLTVTPVQQGGASPWRLPPEVLQQRPPVSVTVFDDGHIGPLQTVAEWWATQVPHDVQTAIWLQAPEDMCVEAALNGMKVDITATPPGLGEPACIVVTVTCCAHMYAALLDAEDAQTRAAVDGLQAGSTCRLVLVNTFNGRPVWTDFQWPRLDLSHVPTGRYVEVLSPNCPSPVRRRAEARAEQTGRRVELALSWVTSASGHHPSGA